MHIHPDHPDYENIIVLDPQGNTVSKLHSLDTATGSGFRFGTDEAGHIIFDTVPRTIRGLGTLNLDRAPRLVPITLHGHRVMYRGGALIADIPAAPAAPDAKL